MNTAKTNIRRVRETLESRQDALERALQTRDGITIEKSADQLDEIQYASERDLAIRNVDRDTAELRQVRIALRRIDDGAFGVCVDCDEMISPKRLAAMPWATRCIQCQQAEEANGHSNGASLPRLEPAVQLMSMPYPISG